ncbi:MAG: diacylglycerol kinase family protein, partial [Erysipelotrichaceae bacterium]
MRNIFILNPAAGQGKALNQIDDIKAAAAELNIDVEFYKTASPIDPEIYCGDIMASMDPNEKIRIYACGGDGTLNEVVNACYGYENVEIGVIPKGTGNDFVRNFGKKEDYFNYKAQLMGESIICNVINYSGVSNGEIINRYCCNMFNIGFDCNVVDLAAKYKKYPLVKGTPAYMLGVLKTLIEMHGTRLKITLDDGTVMDQDFLLVALANGCYCGGGVKGVPKANVTDGFIDVSIINPMTRLKF